MGNYTSHALGSLTSEYEVAEVLAHFNSQYIFDVIQEKIDTKFNIGIVIAGTNPNIVLSFEDNFNRCKAIYPEDLVNIETVRIETYKEVIDIIKSNYNIGFVYYEGIDPYTYAYYLYDFFVCNFADNIAKFFAQYIYANKDALYNSLGLDAFKKQKDSNANYGNYGKTVYDDSKLAIISANIVYVVNAMKSFDITPQDIFSVIYGNLDIVNMLTASIQFQYDPFKQLFYSVPPEYEPILFTNIRLALQQMVQRTEAINYL